MIEESAIATTGVVQFFYDNRHRLVREWRTLSNAYDLRYTYDQGGNRLTKVDANPAAPRRTE